MGDLSEHFSCIEFACRCGCGFDRVDPELVDLLEATRAIYRRRIIILSGCRCEAHNRSIGGAMYSQHKLGKAADIYISGTGERHDLVHAGLQAGAQGVGVAKGFIHLDCGTADEILAIVRPALWTY